MIIKCRCPKCRIIEIIEKWDYLDLVPYDDCEELTKRILKEINYIEKEL